MEKELNSRAIRSMKIVSTTPKFNQIVKREGWIRIVENPMTFARFDATWKNLVMDYGADPAGLNVAATDRA